MDQNSNIIPSWYLTAKREIGVKELINGDNPRIVEYHSYTSLKSQYDHVSWCSAFVCWCLEQNGVLSTRSAWARSFLNWGIKLEKPVLGCITILERGPEYGHVGFYVDDYMNSTGDKILLLAGNQSDAVNISEFKKERVLGYRWPKV